MQTTTVMEILSGVLHFSDMSSCHQICLSYPTSEFSLSLLPSGIFFPPLKIFIYLYYMYVIKHV